MKSKARVLSLREIFSRSVRKKRLQMGLSQEQLAANAGLHRTYVGSIERGERNVSIDNMELIARALDCEVRDLLIFIEGTNE